MRLYRYASNNAGEVHQLYFKVTDDDREVILLASRIIPMGQSKPVHISYFTPQKDADTVIAGLVNLSWKRPDDVPLSVLNYPEVPAITSKTRWQATDVTPDFLATLAGQPLKAPAPEETQGVTLGGIIIVAVVVFSMGYLLGWF